jgi:GAF domain-containing protein
MATATLTFWAKEQADNPSLSGTTRFRWTLFAVLAITVSVGIPAFRQWRTERAVVRAKVTINDALGPVVPKLSQLATMTDPSERAQIRDNLIPMILNSVALVLTIGKAIDRIRVCWYPYDSGTGQLIPGLHVGRSTPPSTAFSGETDAGQAVLELLENRRHLVVGNVQKNPPRGWYIGDHHGDYKSLIAMPVIAGTVGLGMLFVDALSAGALTEADAPLVKLFADHLGSAIVLGSKSWL